MDPEVVQEWLPRAQQIFVAEAMALIAVTANHPHLLYGRDVWGFIDNEAAASAAIRAGAEADVVTAIVQTAHLLWADLRSRVWVVWIGSNLKLRMGLAVKVWWTPGQSGRAGSFARHGNFRGEATATHPIS